MAKSHETRQFSYMQVVDGPIVTFTLAHFFLFLFSEERGKTRKIAKLPDASASTEPHWRIGEVAKLVEKGILPLNHFLNGTGILNIRQIQEFIGAQPDGAKVR